MNPSQPLSEVEAAERLNIYGQNTIASTHEHGFIDRLLGMRHEPMFILLVLATVTYILLGDLNEGLVLGTFVLLILGLTFYQEGKAQNSIALLREFNQPHSKVFRDGSIRDIASTHLVVGDWVHISEGDRVPADGEVLRCTNLEIDESLLTGESVAVHKSVSGVLGTNAAQVFSGTFVVQGQGVFIVKAIGAQTAIGEIGRTLNRLTDTATPLQRQTAQLVKLLSWCGFFLCSIMVLILGFRHGEWLTALLYGIALGMAILPEEYPVVMTIFPALGAHRLARQGVLTRHINSIETLGATTVLCTDKTGTLTQNKMTVQALAVQELSQSDPLILDAKLLQKSHSMHKNTGEVINYSVLASAIHPFDPMETALHTFSRNTLPNFSDGFDGLQLIKSYPPSSDLKAMTQVWRRALDGFMFIATKGAPEAIMDLCQVNDHFVSRWQPILDELTSKGLRVIAVARGTPVDGEWPSTPKSLEFTWLGLIGLSDPVREEVPQAMAECQSAGIRVVMITGDYPVTARTVAHLSGMPDGETITGKEVESLSIQELQQRMRHVNVCARVSPHQKLKIVRALMDSHEIVTMTGDGVNDAPALRAAHVGIAMGAKGTDVAREAADLVLVDDHFSSIVRGIRTGRRIYANLRRSMSYIFSIHIPIACLALFPMLLDQPPLFFPLHIALIEMIIDPACSLAFENEPETINCMQIPPRDTRSPLFDGSTLWQASVQGLLVLLCTLFAFGASHLDWVGEVTLDQSRSMVMVAFVVSNGFLIFASRSPHMTRSKSQNRNRDHMACTFHFKHAIQFLKPTNTIATVIALGTTGLVLLTIYLPWVATHLHFEPLSPRALTMALACGCIGWIFNMRLSSKSIN